MAQITAQRAVEAWHWIANNPHEEVGTEYHDTKVDGQGHPVRTHIYMRNYHDKLRIPEALIAEVFAGIMPNRRKFDTRMYALRKSARERIGA